ncbi:MAG: hypothetical protein M0T73_13035, partial [Deltaproteobacteria bacterium]|nr:hypothetical protein [Deltaproteobacteria bacterium]
METLFTLCATGRNSSEPRADEYQSYRNTRMWEVAIIYGFINSVILALTALGFSLTFGISGVPNFAYGAMYIMAGFVSWLLLNKLAIP